MSNQGGVCQGRSQLAQKSLSNEEKHESFLRKDVQKEQARGVQHQTNQPKLHPLGASVMQSEVSSGKATSRLGELWLSLQTLESQSMGCFVAGQCLLTINSLHDCTSQTFCPYGRKKKKKQNRREKVTREVSCSWQIPTYSRGGSR